MAILITAAAMLLLAQNQSPDQTAPKPIWPGFGVSVNFTNAPTNELNQLKELGVGYVKTELQWNAIEKVQGQYDFSAYDRLAKNLIERGIRPFFVLTGANKLYQDGAPENSAAQSAFARWAGATAAHFQGKEIVWEIWNEPNSGNSWRPAPSPNAYKSLATLSVKLMKQADPNCRVLVGATSGIDQDFLIKSLDPLLLSLVDGISVHPHRQTGPESIWPDWEQIRVLIDALAPENRKKLPLVSSDWGYPTSTKGVSEGRQAMYLVRSWLVNAAFGCPISIYQSWKDEGTDPENDASRFGILTEQLKPKPSFGTAKELLQKFAGCVVYKRYADADPLRWIIVGAGPNKMIRATWYQKDPGIKYEILSPKDGPKMYAELMGKTTSSVPTLTPTPTVTTGPIQVNFAAPLDEDGWFALINKSSNDTTKLEFRYTRKDTGAKVTCFATVTGTNGVEALAETQNSAEVSVNIPGKPPYSVKLLEEAFDPANWLLQFNLENSPAARQPLEPSGKWSKAPYIFTKGNQYFAIEPKFEMPIPVGARKAVIWMKSDRTENLIRSRFQDESGQIFEVNLGTLDSQVQRGGYRAYAIPLDGSGKTTLVKGSDAESKPKGKLQWNSLFIIESANRENPKSGILEFGSIAYEL